MSILDTVVEARARVLAAHIDEFTTSELAKFTRHTSWYNRLLITFRAKKHISLQQQFLSSNRLLLKLWFEARGQKILLGSKEFYY